MLHAMQCDIKQLVHYKTMPPKPISGEKYSISGKYVMALQQIRANCLFLIYIKPILQTL